MGHRHTLAGSDRRYRVRSVFRVILAFIMVVAGALHFVATDAYVAIMPAYLPLHRELVQISGGFEILGGVGLLIARLRAAAGIGLIVLYVAVLPANINMAIHNIQPTSVRVAPGLLWARIPLQLVLIAWAWQVSRPEPNGERKNRRR